MDWILFGVFALAGLYIWMNAPQEKKQEFKQMVTAEVSKKIAEPGKGENEPKD